MMFLGKNCLQTVGYIFVSSTENCLAGRKKVYKNGTERGQTVGVFPKY